MAFVIQYAKKSGNAKPKRWRTWESRSFKTPEAALEVMRRMDESEYEHRIAEECVVTRYKPVKM